LHIKRHSHNGNNGERMEMNGKIYIKNEPYY